MVVGADKPLEEPRNCPSADTKSPDESPCRYSRGNTSSTRGVLRAHGGKIAEEPSMLAVAVIDVGLDAADGPLRTVAAATRMSAAGMLHLDAEISFV